MLSTNMGTFLWVVVGAHFERFHCELGIDEVSGVAVCVQIGRFAPALMCECCFRGTRERKAVVSRDMSVTEAVFRVLYDLFAVCPVYNTL